MSKHEVPMDWENRPLRIPAHWEHFHAVEGGSKTGGVLLRFNNGDEILVRGGKHDDQPDAMTYAYSKMKVTRWQRFTNYLRRKLREFREWGA